jgi:hypothetical protein
MIFWCLVAIDLDCYIKYEHIYCTPPQKLADLSDYLGGRVPWKLNLPIILNRSKTTGSAASLEI